jgi:hypothetical protein
LADFDDNEGRSYPTYYTHSLAGEIHLENDLDRLNQKGLVKALEDETAASKGLIQALRAGQKVATVADWQHSPTNIAAATEHFLSVAVRETKILSGKTKEECLQYAFSWLTGADKLATNLYSVGGFNSRTELNHQAAWLQAFNRFVAVTGVL